MKAAAFAAASLVREKPPKLVDGTDARTAGASDAARPFCQPFEFAADRASSVKPRGLSRDTPGGNAKASTLQSGNVVSGWPFSGGWFRAPQSDSKTDKRMHFVHAKPRFARAPCEISLANRCAWRLGWKFVDFS